MTGAGSKSGCLSPDSLLWDTPLASLRPVAAVEVFDGEAGSSCWLMIIMGFEAT